MGVTRSNVARVSGSNSTFAGTVRITGGPNVTVGTDASGLSISAAAQTVQTQNVVDLTLSGNTAGVMALVSSGTMTLAGGNNITLSQNANAVTISGAAQSVQTQDVLSVGASNLGNTAGNTTVNTGSRLVIVGTNNLTVSQGTAAGATTLTLSGPATNPAFSLGASNLGNTAGSTGVTGTRIVFVGSGANTLSQSTDATGATITFNDGANTLSQFDMIHQAGVPMANVTNLTAVTQRPFFVPFELDDYVQWNDLFLEVSRSTTGSDAMTLQAALYTFVNSTQVSRLASLQNVFSATATASNSGLRHIRLTGIEAAWTSLTPGPYVMMLYASAGNTGSMNYSIRGWSTAAIQGVVGGGTDAYTTATSALSTVPYAVRFGGRWTTTTASPPATIGFSDVQHWTSYIPAWFRLMKT